MLKTNFHTHTARCGHASGTDEEYVLAAIKAGIKTLGFSDHAPYNVPEEGIRMPMDQYTDYVSSIRFLQEKYKDQITIYIGLEAEFFEDQWETLRNYRNELDYIILGQHRLSVQGLHSSRITDGKDLMVYADLIEGACRHGLCDYICHPDLVMYNYPRTDDSVRALAARLADISLKYNMPMEINCGSGVINKPRVYEDGVRPGYPQRVFFEEFARKKCPVIIGLDVHDPEWFLTDTYLNRAMAILEGLDLNLLTDFDLPAAAAERKKTFY